MHSDRVELTHRRRGASSSSSHLCRQRCRKRYSQRCSQLRLNQAIDILADFYRNEAFVQEDQVRSQLHSQPRRQLHSQPMLELHRRSEIIRTTGRKESWTQPSPRDTVRSKMIL